MKKCLAILLLAFPSLGFCDAKISALTSTTSMSTSDIIPVVVTPGSTPANRIITFQNFYNSIPSTVTAASIGALTTSSAAATYLQFSSATATYLQFSSATATYLQNSSATVTYAPISGSANYIRNGTSVQSATFNVSSGTAANFNAGVITSTQGIILTNTAGYVIGSVIQSSACVDGTDSAISSNTFQPIHMQCVITPKVATSVVRVTLTGDWKNRNVAVTTGFLTIKRNGTDLAATGGNGFIGIGSGSTGLLTQGLSVGPFLDSPASASALTYKVNLRSTDNTTLIDFINNCMGYMLLEEIAQ